MQVNFDGYLIYGYLFKVYAMNIKTSWVFLVLSLCSFNASSSNDASSLRCGHKLVMLGDYKGDVLEKCGQPESVEYRTRIVGWAPPHPRRTFGVQIFDEIQIEEWIYNFGRYRFQQLLRFENGVLVEIDSIGRGY